MDAQARVERRAHLLDGLEQLAQALEREELALQRHQHGVRGRHRVDGEEVQRRRAVDQDVGERRRSCGSGDCMEGVGRPREGAGRRSCSAAISSSTPSRSSVDGATQSRGHRRVGSTDLAERRRRRSGRRRSRPSRLLRSMPRPVDALPCGSRSTISTRSPIAASAVPRLMAVVVLPTPPFWLARASTRGWLPDRLEANGIIGHRVRRLDEIGYETTRGSALSNDHDPGPRIGDAVRRRCLDLQYLAASVNSSSTS